MKDICVLFDMDGVILDTEPQYDKFWKHAGDRYNVGIPNFEKVIKGTTLPGILKKYFSFLTQEERDRLSEKVEEFEVEMDFPEIPGALQFVETLKAAGVRVGLVTSSTESKMVRVYEKKHLDEIFETLVTAAHITHGKPNPECYLLAAKNLGVDPKNCIVFEDSFAGIEAGKAAGMTVIGVATTNEACTLVDKCKGVIGDFENFSIADLKKIIT